MYSSGSGRGASLAGEEGHRAPTFARARAPGPSIAMVTAYDFTMARLVDEAGVDIVLVGDSLGMVVQGLANTLPVTLDEICLPRPRRRRGARRERTSSATCRS